MRKLIFQDVISVAQIMRKTNIKENIYNMLKSDELKSALTQKENAQVNKDIQKQNNIDTATALGVNMAVIFVEILGDNNVEQDIYNLLTDIFEEDAQSMELSKLTENINILAKENNLSNFLKSASQLTQ